MKFFKIQSIEQENHTTQEYQIVSAWDFNNFLNRLSHNALNEADIEKLKDGTLDLSNLLIEEEPIVPGLKEVKRRRSMNDKEYTNLLHALQRNRVINTINLSNNGLTVEDLEKFQTIVFAKNNPNKTLTKVILGEGADLALLREQISTDPKVIEKTKNQINVLLKEYPELEGPNKSYPTKNATYAFPAEDFARTYIGSMDDFIRNLITEKRKLIKEKEKLNSLKEQLTPIEDQVKQGVNKMSNKFSKLMTTIEDKLGSTLGSASASTTVVKSGATKDSNSAAAKGSKTRAAKDSKSGAAKDTKIAEPQSQKDTLAKNTKNIATRNPKIIAIENAIKQREQGIEALTRQIKERNEESEMLLQQLPKLHELQRNLIKFSTLLTENQTKENQLGQREKILQDQIRIITRNNRLHVSAKGAMHRSKERPAIYMEKAKARTLVDKKLAKSQHLYETTKQQNIAKEEARQQAKLEEERIRIAKEQALLQAKVEEEKQKIEKEKLEALHEMKRNEEEKQRQVTLEKNAKIFEPVFDKLIQDLTKYRMQKWEEIKEIWVDDPKQMYMTPRTAITRSGIDLEKKKTLADETIEYLQENKEVLLRNPKLIAQYLSIRDAEDYKIRREAGIGVTGGREGSFFGRWHERHKGTLGKLLGDGAKRFSEPEKLLKDAEKKYPKSNR